MGTVVKLDANRHFADVDTLSRKIFKQVPAFSCSEDGEPPRPDLPVTFNKREPRTQTEPQRRCHGGVTQYLNLPNVDILQSKSREFDEQTTLAAIRNLMVEQEKHANWAALPNLDPAEVADHSDGSTDDTPEVTEPAATDEITTAQNITPLQDQGRSGLLRRVIGVVPWLLLGLPIPFAFQFFEVAALTLGGALSALALLRGFELIIGDFVEFIRAGLDRNRVRTSAVRRLVFRFTQRQVDGPSRHDIAPIVGNMPKITIEQVLSELGYARHDMTLQLAEHVARELCDMGWQNGGRKTRTPRLRPSRKATFSNAG